METFKSEYYALNMMEQLDKHPNWDAVQVEMYNPGVLKFKKPTSATGIESLTKDYCRLKGAVCTKIYAGGRPIVNDPAPGRIKPTVKYIPSTTRPGTSDLIIGKNGKIVYVEVKYGKDSQSPDQKEFQKEVERCGNVYLILRDLDQLPGIFDKYLTQ